MTNNLHNRRIIFVITSLDFGGAQKQAFVLAKKLRDKYKAEISFAGFGKTSDEFTDILDKENISWKQIEIPWTYSRIYLFLNFIAELRKLRPDFIFSYCYTANIVSSLFWKFTGARSCIWNQRDEGLAKYFINFGKLPAKLASHFISNSEGGKSYLIKKFSVRESKINVIHNGIELKSVGNKDNFRKQNNIPANTLVACMIANLSVHKDHVNLLASWAIVVKKLNEQNINALLLLAGAFGGTEKKIQELIEELNIRSNVKLLGFVKDTSELLGMSDMAVFSSRSEGSPNGLLECMAAGLPIIGTNIAGIKSCVSEENYPYLFLSEDYNSFGNGILELFADPELRNKIGKKNFEKIQKDFSIEKMTLETASILDRINLL